MAEALKPEHGLEISDKILGQPPPVTFLFRIPLGDGTTGLVVRRSAGEECSEFNLQVAGLEFCKLKLELKTSISIPLQSLELLQIHISAAQHADYF